jgi:DNA-binding NarL/FixJ family response regulator
MNQTELKTPAEIKIIIADDHPLVRQGLRQAIELESNFRVIAEAGDGQTALDLIEKHEPHIVVLDVDMPALDGFGVAYEIKRRCLNIKIVFLTFHGEEEYLNEALETGAKGYLLKDNAITDVISCLKAVVSGQSYISPTLSMYLINRARNAPNGSALDQLSPTERHILKLLAEYKTSKEIAREIGISPHTVSTHRANIALKLDLRGSHTLMKFALERKADL